MPARNANYTGVWADLGASAQSTALVPGTTDTYKERWTSDYMNLIALYCSTWPADVNANGKKLKNLLAAHVASGGQFGILNGTHLTVTNAGIGYNNDTPGYDWDHFSGALGTGPDTIDVFSRWWGTSDNLDQLFLLRRRRGAGGLHWDSAEFRITRGVDEEADTSYVSFGAASGKTIALGTDELDRLIIDENGWPVMPFMPNFANNGAAVDGGVKFGGLYRDNSNIVHWRA